MSILFEFVKVFGPNDGSKHVHHCELEVEAHDDHISVRLSRLIQGLAFGLPDGLYTRVWRILFWFIVHAREHYTAKHLFGEERTKRDVLKQERYQICLFARAEPKVCTDYPHLLSIHRGRQRFEQRVRGCEGQDCHHFLASEPI